MPGPRLEPGSRLPPRRIVLAGAVLLATVVGAVGWYYSGLILGPDAPKPFTGQRILARTDTTITLASTPKARRPGYWAIQWTGGHGHIGPLVSVDSDRVVTRFEWAKGSPPDSESRLAGFAMEADPGSWLGLVFEQRSIPSRVGPLPAWFVPGIDSTWAVFVHGRAATRAEVLRMLPAYTALGLPCLVIAYRNDADGPTVAGGQYRLGATEWQDLEDAVRYARSQGARDVVVVGCSMGGAIVAQYLRRSSERGATRAAVMDAPALDWSVVLAQEGRRRNVPGPVTAWGRFVARLRTGLDWADLSQARHAAEFSTPMLVLHGEADDTVPVGLSRAFATARPDLVTLHVTPGAGHVESANVDPEGYAATIARWMHERGIGTAAP